MRLQLRVLGVEEANIRGKMSFLKDKIMIYDWLLQFRNDSIYDEFKAQELGTTFVELIKRPGTYLGVVVSDREPKIAQLVPGSWAQRSDVLCVGDRIISVNGMAAESLSHDMLARTLDDSDRIQLEVRYRLPPQPTILGRRKKGIQVRILVKIAQHTLET